MKIVFMGSADFGIAALKLLMEHHSIVGIVSTPAKAQGRGLKIIDSPVAVFAEQHGLKPIFKPQDLKSTEFKKQLSELNADLFVVVAFKILPKDIFSIPPLGTVNIHASLLPKFRGPAPIQRAIEAGEKETGVTIFRIDEGIDTGEILSCQRISIGSQETTPELYERLSKCGAEMLLKSIDNMKNNVVNYCSQEHLLSSKAPKLNKSEAHIDWSQSVNTIFNKIRAFKPFPGTYSCIDDKRVGIDWATVVDEKSLGINGQVSGVYDEYFDVQCNPGTLRILSVKPEGRKIMSVHDFLLGNRLEKGIVLK